MLDWETIIAEPIQEMLTKITSFLPTLLGALIILIVGWIIAKIIRNLVNRLLEVIRFNVIADKAGVSNVLTKGGVRLTPKQMLSGLAYWLVMIMVLVMVVNALGLTVASQLLEGLLAYIPKVIAALFVLVLGMFLGIMAGQKSGGNEIWGGLIGMILFAAISVPLMKWCVSLLGAIAGGVVTAGIWIAFDLSQTYLPAGFIVGFVAGGLISFIMLKASVMLFTSLGGSLFPAHNACTR